MKKVLMVLVLVCSAGVSVCSGGAGESGWC